MEARQQTTRLIRFGPFEVDLRARELRRDGVKVKLQDQPFRVLARLLAQPGDVVTREELRQAIWPPGTHAEFDEGLDATIYKLRSALEDSAEHPRFVETLPRLGYRFIAGAVPIVAPEAGGGALLVRHGSLVWTAGVVGLVAVLALVLGANPVLRDRLRGRGTGTRIRSLAVLPLRNLSGDSTQAYFAEGMTEALVTTLGKTSGLRVISHTSTLHYQGTHETLPTIARQLHADAVVEGAVLRVGDRVRVTAQLVEGATDRHLWAETYERQLQDVLELQDEVARAITREVQARLRAPEHAPLARSSARPVNPEAYDLYLKGRAEWNEWTEHGLKQSIEYFEQAAQKDPSYAPAWAGLADAYSLSGLFGFLPSAVALPNAKTAALRAIQLDQTLSEAHVALAGVQFHLEWSWAAAEKQLQQAVALDPNNAMAHQWYGYYLSALGQFDGAVDEMRLALELDPLSPNKQNALAATLYRAGRYDEALAQFRAVPDPDVNSESRHRRIAAIYERLGMPSAAVAEWLTGLRLAGKGEAAASVERTYRAAGYAEAKRALLVTDIEAAQPEASHAYPRPRATDIAADYAMLSERGKAFEWLDRAVREREGSLIWLKVDDRFDGLRSDPRFPALLRRVGFGS